MGHTGRWIKIILICLAAAFVALFTLQNLGRVSDLSLNLWFVAYKLKTPQPIPFMLLIAFGAGLLFAGFFGSLQRMALQRKLNNFERENVRAGLREPDDDWT